MLKKYGEKSRNYDPCKRRGSTGKGMDLLTVVSLKNECQELSSTLDVVREIVASKNSSQESNEIIMIQLRELFSGVSYMRSL